MAERIIREQEVKHRTGLSRTTRWRMERAGTFPKRRCLGPACVGWVESEIEAWIRERAAAEPGGDEQTADAALVASASR